ncbi:MAG: Uma2 family endonuclease [Planctomycetaceae bacterium]
MNPVTVPLEIDYPESDGKPMGETELHRNWTIRILEILQQRYRGQSVYVTSDLLLYYEEGSPTKFVVPDCFVVRNCATHLRRTYQTWKEGRVPDVVIEVTSRSTSRTDTVDKPIIYEMMGVQEYFLYDPTSDYLESSLQGYRLIDGQFREITPINGGLRCLTLGVDLSVHDQDLQIIDCETGVAQLTEAEFQQAARLEAEQGQKREHAARVAAEDRVRELEEELRRLRNNQS